jgi:hypothetical protein
MEWEGAELVEEEFEEVEEEEEPIYGEVDEGDIQEHIVESNLSITLLPSGNAREVTLTKYSVPEIIGTRAKQLEEGYPPHPDVYRTIIINQLALDSNSSIDYATRRVDEQLKNGTAMTCREMRNALLANMRADDSRTPLREQPSRLSKPQDIARLEWQRNLLHVEERVGV